MKTIRKFFRFSIEDQSLLEEVMKNRNTDSEALALRMLLREAVDSKGKFKGKVTEEDDEEPLYNPYKSWRIEGPFWEYESGTNYLLAKEPVKPFRKETIKEGLPLYRELKRLAEKPQTNG